MCTPIAVIQSEVTKDTPWEQLPQNIRDYCMKMRDNDCRGLAHEFSREFLQILSDAGFSIIYDWLEKNAPEEMIDVYSAADAIRMGIADMGLPEGAKTYLWDTETVIHVARMTRLIQKFAPNRFDSMTS
ncbi:MAG TPA: hypothetical protein DCO75_13465 [Fibrobacteres bacterium]|nr:hypothetical protein [Fibrobacterota bacterium]